MPAIRPASSVHDPLSNASVRLQNLRELMDTLETLPPQQHHETGCNMGVPPPPLRRSCSTRQYSPSCVTGHQSSASLDFGPLDDDEAFGSRGEAAPSRERRPGLSQKYQPKVFDEIIGHEMVIRALCSAVQSRRVSPLYLFHGPGGTGKTSAAKVFAMALNCESTSPLKPCWGCSGCSRSMYAAELCSGNRISGFENIKTLLRSTAFMQTFHGFKVFIIDECQSLPDDSWGQLLDMIELENGCGSLVFVVIVEDVNRVPRAISSRCQKFSFTKLRSADITLKLERIVGWEGIEIGGDALKLIAEKVEGDLREAENMLDQLALLGQAITGSMVQQLVGLVPHEKLVHLLEAVLWGDSVEAMRSTKNLITYSIEPRVLLLQLASLITEILPGASGSLTEKLPEESSMRGRTRLQSIQPKRLHGALKILIDTEKQLRMSSCNHTTWVTAALLQIASDGNSNGNPTSTLEPTNFHLADTKSNAASKIDPMDFNNPGPSNTTDTSHHQSTRLTVQQPNSHPDKVNTIIESMNLEEVWRNILGRIPNKSVEEFLQTQTKLMSLTVSRANAIVHLMFTPSERTRSAEMFEESISKALEDALGCPITINVSHDPRQQEVPMNYVASTKKVTYPTHPEEPRPPLLERTRSQKPAVSSRSKMSRNSGRIQFQINEHVGRRHGDIIPEAGPVQSSHLRQASKDITPVVTEQDISVRDQPPLKTPISKLTDHSRNKVLSISSILKADASVEPYSQDLLFEAANTDNQRESRNSRIYDDLHAHNMDYMELSRSWSCAERFCRGETTVKGNMKERVSKRNALQQPSSGKDSTNPKPYR